MSGYLYLATNPVMPGLTKIGFTESVLADRFAALQSTGVPLPFELYAALRVEDARICEKAVHGALENVRLADNREFFRIAAKDALSKVLPLVLTHTVSEQNSGSTQETQFSDLDEDERDILAAFTMAPSIQRPHDWEWLKNVSGMTELDGRHYFHSLKVKGYLREVRGTRGAILYDLAPRAVAYGRMVRENPEYQERFGNEGFFYK